MTSKSIEKVDEPYTEIRRGRPRIEDKDKTLTATKPWEKAGMSRSTYYNRKKEEKP
jgi:hypothetical protein